ncbi:uncharacterized protein LOC110820040 [Carica papaya]|uniref:uncharacterized protein LOC110820040 n=1 Tax=Carica papaya TaxID=3649 RepID=UPI000B8CDBEF|nr:uncharacterized protein LOC110820040 [Carica papaya]
MPPPASDANSQTWEIEDSMVMSWLITSMTLEIGENFLLYKTAHEIWKAAQELYSSKQNTSAIFEIESTLHNLRQGELSVTQYYSILSRNWQQMDAFKERHWNCPEDAKNFKVFVEKKRVFKFLLGLNKNLDAIRICDLSTKPLPSLREVFSEVRREESRRKIMMGENDQPHQIENSSALITRAIDSRTKKTRSWCDHCRKLGHTRECCWKLHGKPSDWKPPSEKGQVWVVDSGASDHMSGDFSMFQNYRRCEENISIRIADSSLSKVAGMDSDLDSGRTIGNARMSSGLYLL